MLPCLPPYASELELDAEFKQRVDMERYHTRGGRACPKQMHRMVLLMVLLMVFYSFIKTD